MTSTTSCRGYFYPRPPRGGRRGSLLRVCKRERFLSTPSARRATLVELLLVHLAEISIHALREEGDRRTKRSAQPQRISIHALREEGDYKNV